jgi:hypothetical protein
VPEVGRVIVIGDAWISHVFPPMSGPKKSTLMGADAAAVVGSVTMIFIPVDIGCPAARVITPTDPSKGTMTKGTGLESCESGGGF